jgi:hypothetical protein
VKIILNSLKVIIVVESIKALPVSFSVFTGYFDLLTLFYTLAIGDFLSASIVQETNSIVIVTAILICFNRIILLQ